MLRELVRPDVAMPGNGLTLAVLRELAAFVAVPGASGIKSIPDLAGKRLGMLASRTADRTLLRNLLAYHGLELVADVPADGVGSKSIALVPVDEADVVVALRDGRIDAMALVTTPASPAARRLVGRVAEAGRTGEVALIGFADAAALLARWPRLQSVSVPAALYGGSPRVPDEDVATVGSSYRLMARQPLAQPRRRDHPASVRDARRARRGLAGRR